jgi:hypothetical protein
VIYEPFERLDPALKRKIFDAISHWVDTGELEPMMDAMGEGYASIGKDPQEIRSLVDFYFNFRPSGSVS